MGLNVYKYYQSAPPWGKFAIISAGIAGGILIYVTGRSILKYFQHQKDLKGQRQTVADAGNALQTLKAQGQNPSYNAAQYSAWASSIQTAFQGCDPLSDDMAAVMEAVKGARNDADMWQLVKAFGVRKWDECGYWTGDAELDLVGGVRHELDGIQIGLINKSLAEKNISFRF